MNYGSFWDKEKKKERKTKEKKDRIYYMSTWNFISFYDIDITRKPAKRSALTTSTGEE